jgi:hypothetical protein
VTQDTAIGLVDETFRIYTVWASPNSLVEIRGVHFSSGLDAYYGLQELESRAETEDLQLAFERLRWHRYYSLERATDAYLEEAAQHGAPMEVLYFHWQ